MVDKIDPLVSLAPVLVTRLKGLKGLHAEAAVFSDSIKMISSEQTKISEELRGLDTVSTKVTRCSLSQCLLNKCTQKIRDMQGNEVLTDFHYTFLCDDIVAGEFDGERCGDPKEH